MAQKHTFSGPALGSVLYSYGGFSLPFLSVGIFGTITALSLGITIPDVNNGDSLSDSDDESPPPLGYDY